MTATAIGVAEAAGIGSAESVLLTQPRAGHAYRRGAIPLRVGRRSSSLSALRASVISNASVARGRLTYHGGPVVTGRPKVYLVFWGSQWGTQSVVGGYQAFSGDPAGMAPYLQRFFAGLGTGDELWSATALQYCEGVSSGTTKCPFAAMHVPYPQSGVLAGVWEDTSFTASTGSPGSPSTPGATATQIAQEAENAAAHFADTSPNAQYFVVSPTGTNPDGWSDPISGYCAYHDSSIAWVAGPDVAYTNLPYVTDAAAGPTGTCSSGVASSPAGIDAVTEVAGHEYYETLTDPFQTVAWQDARGSEIGDKCESIAVGQAGGPANLTLATGSFPVQSMWANDVNSGRGGCVLLHSTILVSGPAKQIGAVGAAVNLPIVASDGLSGRSMTYTAANLPHGLSINSASGVIFGTPTATTHTTVTITVADTFNTATVTIKWIVRRH